MIKLKLRNYQNKTVFFQLRNKGLSGLPDIAPFTLESDIFGFDVKEREIIMFIRFVFNETFY